MKAVEPWYSNRSIVDWQKGQKLQMKKTEDEPSPYISSTYSEETPDISLPL